MTTFFLTDYQILFKINRVQAVHNIDKVSKFHENLTSNTDYHVNKKCEFLTQNYFSITNCLILFKSNRVEAIYEVDKLCKFHENLTKNVDFIARRKQEKD